MNTTTTLERNSLTQASQALSPATDEPPRPVKLQVNRTGLWHDVATFDAGSEIAEQHMREGVQMLCALDHRTSFRVVVATGLAVAGAPLLHYCTNGGWITK